MRQTPSQTLAAALLLAVACGAPSESSDGAELRIISSVPAPDTIETAVADPLEAMLVDRSGDPMAGVEIRWSTDGGVWFARQPGSPFADSALDTTDAGGLTSIFVYRGSRSGPATIRVRAESASEGDSLTLQIAAGNPASVQALPADTTLRVGAGIRLRATVRDRAGNPRGDIAALHAVAGAAAITLTDYDSLGAQQTARAAVEASFDGLADTAWISVVPNGSIAAFRTSANTGGRDELAVFDTDGRNWQTIWQSPFHSFYEAALAWHPSGDAMAFVDVIHPPNRQIYRIDLQGVVTEAISPTESQPGNLAPQYSSDGAWLHYTGVDNPGTGGTALYRKSVDGQVEQVVFPGSIYTTDTEGSPSPDGGRIAFVTDRPDLASTRADLAIYTVADDAIQLIGIPARTPRWSPTGDVVAFVRDGQIWMVNADGSDPRLLATETMPYLPGLSWSPDGSWIAAATEDGVRMVEAATGLILPLAFTQGFASPAWHP